MFRLHLLLFTGERVTAQEGKEWGLINHVMPRADLDVHAKPGEPDRGGADLWDKMLKRSLNRVADIQGYTSSLNAHFDTHIVSRSSKKFWDIINQGREESVAVATAKIAG